MPQLRPTGKKIRRFLLLPVPQIKSRGVGVALKNDYPMFIAQIAADSCQRIGRNFCERRKIFGDVWVENLPLRFQTIADRGLYRSMTRMRQETLNIGFRAGKNQPLMPRVD